MVKELKITLVITILALAGVVILQTGFAYSEFASFAVVGLILLSFISAFLIKISNKI